MNQRKFNELTEEQKDLLINTAYGDVNLLQKKKAYSLIRNNNEARELFDQYKQTADAVGKLEPEDFPESILQKNILYDFNNNGYKNNSGRLFLKPVFAVAAALIVSFIIFFTMVQSNSNNTKFTDEELARADEQVKQTLIIVSQVFNKSEKKLEETVFPEHVNKPLQKGFSIVNNIFSGGS